MTDSLVAVVGGECFAVDRDCARDKSSLMTRRAGRWASGPLLNSILRDHGAAGPWIKGRRRGREAPRWDNRRVTAPLPLAILALLPRTRTMTQRLRRVTKGKDDVISFMLFRKHGSERRPSGIKRQSSRTLFQDLPRRPINWFPPRRVQSRRSTHPFFTSNLLPLNPVAPSRKYLHSIVRSTGHSLRLCFLCKYACVE